MSLFHSLLCLLLHSNNKHTGKQPEGCNESGTTQKMDFPFCEH